MRIIDRIATFSTMIALAIAGLVSPEFVKFIIENYKPETITDIRKWDEPCKENEHSKS
jgi:hypothetical protein